jgi:hypothetical protein
MYCQVVVLSNILSYFFLAPPWTAVRNLLRVQEWVFRLTPFTRHSGAKTCEKYHAVFDKYRKKMALHYNVWEIKFKKT